MIANCETFDEKPPSSGGKAIKPLLLTMGDPAGVGPLISIGAWRVLRDSPEHAFGLIAVMDCIRSANLGPDPINLIPVESVDDIGSVFPKGLPILEMDGPSAIAGRPDVSSAVATTQSIETAVDLVCSDRADAVVTNPISKSLLYEAGFPHPGHTEFLAQLAQSHFGGDLPRPVMLLAIDQLKVALATIHSPLAEVPNLITQSSLTELGKIVHEGLIRDFGVPSPKLAFAGLNPHAGEDGTIGTEEIEIINPAAEALRLAGVDISDARPGDTVFAEAVSGRYDVVLAMYHDQGLAPLKTLDLWNGVNMTIGLPFVRTSPDHGTAYDAAASGSARSDSLIAAIRMARTAASNRRKHQASL